MDREAFLNRKVKTTDIDLDDGSILKARKLTQSEVETLNKRFKGEDKALEGMRYIVSRCVVEDSGRRMFSDDDAAKLAETDFETVNAIAAEVMRFSGLRVDAKNA